MKMKTKTKKSLAALSAIVMASSGFGYNCLSSAAYSSQGDEVVSYAENQVGVIGHRPNAVTDFYNAVGEWCAMFIYFCASNVGLESKFPYSSYCDDYNDENLHIEGGVTYFKNRNSFYYSKYMGGTYTPERGDVIYFDWGNAYGYRDGKADHVGYVSYFDGSYVYTTEGNVNDEVKNRCYSIDSPDILGYGKPAYDDETAPGAQPPVVQQPTGQQPTEQQPSVEPPASDNSVNETPTENAGYGSTTYTVTSDIGAWARYSDSFGDNKIGIVSTGTVLVSDKQSGSWIHFQGIPIEGSYTCYDGWINITTLTAGNISCGDVTQTPEPEYPEISQPQVSSGILEYGYISSNVGAWFRSSAYFGEDNKMGALDSGANIDIYSVNGEWLYVGAYLYGTYTYGYVHNSTVQRGSSTEYNANGYEIENASGTMYTIMSEIGANFRQDPDYNSNIICVLGQYQQAEVMSISGEWAFARIFAYGGYIYGYINTCNF